MQATVPQAISSRPDSSVSLKKASSFSRRHSAKARYTLPNARRRSTRIPRVSTVAQAGGSGGVFSKSAGRALPSKMSAICSQPTRSEASRPGSLPKVATTRWRGPRAVRTDSTSDHDS
jgi:hypothetical protein